MGRNKYIYSFYFGKKKKEIQKITLLKFIFTIITLTTFF